MVRTGRMGKLKDVSSDGGFRKEQEKDHKNMERGGKMGIN